MSGPGQELIVRDDAAVFMPAMSVQTAVARYQQFAGFVREILRDGVDFGSVPGCDRPALMKPGAEKLCVFFGLRPTFSTVESIERWDEPDPLFYYRVKVTLWRGDTAAAEGEGSCNSRESRYRWRWVPKSEIPTGLGLTGLRTRDGVRSEFAFAVDKAETSGAFGKPAEYWAEFHAAIADGSARPSKKTTKSGKICPAWQIGATIYRVPNPDIFDQVNTILKIAQKRALIAAVLVATSASEFFTQDVDDFAADTNGHGPEPSPADDTAPAGSAQPETPPARAWTGGSASSQASGPGASSSGAKKAFDFGGMVEQFTKIRDRLIEIGGDKAGREAYYRVLADFGCKHANEFKSSNVARRAFKVLAATAEKWEAAPTEQAEDEPASDSGSLFEDEPLTEDESADEQGGNL